MSDNRDDKYTGKDDFDWDKLFDNSFVSEPFDEISSQKSNNTPPEESFDPSDSVGGTKMFDPVKPTDTGTVRNDIVNEVNDEKGSGSLVGDDFMLVEPVDDIRPAADFSDFSDNQKSDYTGENKLPYERNNRNKSKKKKKKKKSVPRKIGTAILAVFLIGVISVCLFIGAFLVYVFAFVDDSVDNDLYNLNLDYTTIIYAKDGDGKDVELTRLHADQNRVWISLEEMPKNLQNAFVSAEDKRFNDHEGVDWKRTFAALLNEATGMLGSQQGGSTITQQLVKNLTNDKATEGVSGYMRKVREIMRARYIEKNYAKADILAAYLNTIHLGSGIDGVEVASYYYFDKKASELSLVQCACLAAITKSPEGYDPYKNPEDNKSRRNWVLDEMCNNGYISKDECEKAKKADLGLRKDPQPTLSRTEKVSSSYYSWFVDACIDQVIKDLAVKLDCSEDTAQSKLFRGGYKIYTTENLSIQKTLEEEFNDDDNFARVDTENDRTPQAAMTIMDYQGHVVGLVGGRGEKKGNRLFNRATNPRQTGSSIKPVSVYAPAIQYNVITFGSRMDDEPVREDEYGDSWPVNYSGYYSGNVTILYALEQSLNTIPVKLVNEMGLQTSFDFLTKNMGITTYVKDKKVGDRTVTDLTESSLALGGSAYGCTTTELTAAYATFGNLGKYYKPYTYTKVTDHKGDEVVLKQADPTVAMSEGTSKIMNIMLQRVTTSGTGSPASFGNWKVFSKTGTTTDTKDRWFVGGTPYYVSAVWFGIDENEAMTIYGSTNPALRLWNAVMPSIHEDLDNKDYPDTDDAVLVKYCTSSGFVANSGCYSTAVGYFKKDYQPVCTKHDGSSIDWSEYDLSYSSN